MDFIIPYTEAVKDAGMRQLIIIHPRIPNNLLSDKMKEKISSMTPDNWEAWSWSVAENRHYMEWTQFCETVARRYATYNLYYQIDNEPNNIPYWNPSVHAKMIIAAAQGLRAGDPNCKIVWGGLGHGKPGCLSPAEWFRKWSEVPQSKNAYDIMGVHVYGKEGMIDIALQQTNKEIWLDEDGYEVTPSLLSGISLGQQAEFVNVAYLRRLLRSPRITKVFWFTLDPSGFSGYSLGNWDVGPKPRLKDWRPSGLRYREIVQKTMP
jgi:hypothetical protein